MKINDWLKQAEQKLAAAGIGTARLDALILAEDALGHDRAYLLAHPDLVVKDQNLNKLEQQIDRRLKHEPLAYIRGKTEFYGREFYIDNRVLEPRPESETMIDLLKGVKDQNTHIVDVGTGSGALAITAKLELPNAVLNAIDIDPKCIQVAKQNAKQHKVDIEFIQGDLLSPLAQLKLSKFPLILLCNLPYVPDDFTINPAAMSEPKIAIFGGSDGLDLYRQLFEQINDYKLNVKYILTESLPPQHTKLGEIAEKHGFKQSQKDDFILEFERASR